MLLTQDQEMIRDAVREFVREQITPHAARWDKEHHFPHDVHHGLAQLGAYGVVVPEEYGGAGLDYLTLALVLEEIAAGDGGTSTAISVTNCPYNAILMRYGSEAQKRQWLAPAARGEMLGAFCLTEPQVGSDASAMRTTATLDGGDYVINGVKQFITSGKNGQVAIVIAVTDPAAGDFALNYSKERESFGQPIFNHQAVGFRLAECATQVEAARQLIWHAASLRDAGRPCLKEAAMAKLFATEMAERVCSAAIQTLGGYGYVSDFPLERIYRDVRVCQIYEGTSDVQKILIQRALA